MCFHIAGYAAMAAFTSAAIGAGYAQYYGDEACKDATRFSDALTLLIRGTIKGTRYNDCLTEVTIGSTITFAVTGTLVTVLGRIAYEKFITNPNLIN
jgi:hypothetical protein